jgi:hypothetical protein
VREERGEATTKLSVSSHDRRSLAFAGGFVADGRAVFFTTGETID